VPHLGEAVAGALRGDGAAVELAGQTHREVTDVDHFLDLAQGFGADLADFDGDEVGQVTLVLSEQVSQSADKYAAAGGRCGAPGKEGLAAGGYGLLSIDRGSGPQPEQVLAGDRGAGVEVGAFLNGDTDALQAGAGAGVQVLGGGQGGTGHGAPLGRLG
jgi:hypothetical protein